MRLFGSHVGKFTIAVAGWAVLALCGEAYAQSAQRDKPSRAANGPLPLDRQGHRKPPQDRAAIQNLPQSSILVESLQESLAEGIVTGHQNMPEFRLEKRSDRRLHRLS